MTMPNRREFVTSTGALFGGGLLWLSMPALATLSGCARDAARRGDPFTHFTPEQGRTMRAFTERIIPGAEGLPGAGDAGAAWFIDRALTGPMQEAAGLVAEGLADLDVRADAAHGRAFADLEPEQQDEVLRAIEDTPFFDAARFFTILGTFSHPDYGGNRDHAGFRLLQIEHQPAYQPPFGYYDEQFVRETGGAA